MFELIILGKGVRGTGYYLFLVMIIVGSLVRVSRVDWLGV